MAIRDVTSDPFMSRDADFLGAIEVHSVHGIRDVLATGASATDRINGKTPVEYLIEAYKRSTDFAGCLQVLIDAGASIEDPLIEAVLLDDDARLRRILAEDERDPLHRKLRVRCAFTGCDGASALHLCAEFNSVRCARVLLEAGADVNARAAIDGDGFGGQTPIFHTVNNIFNYCRPILELLAEAGADLDVRLRGLVWGLGMAWETAIVDVTPMSYAQCGLHAQFHRREQDVYSNLAYLYRRRHGTELPMRNVPNKYLTGSR